MTLEEQAKALYESMDSIQSCPPWDSLGDVTKGLWRDRVAQSICNRPPTPTAAQEG